MKTYAVKALVKSLRLLETMEADVQGPAYAEVLAQIRVAKENLRMALRALVNVEVA